jgi:hypothetical protein
VLRYPTTLSDRVAKGVSPEAAITTPARSSRKLPTLYVTAWGETKTVNEWSKDARCKVTRATLTCRLRRHTLPPEAAILTPAQRWVHRRADASESQ